MPEYRIISRGKYRKTGGDMPVTVDSFVIAENEEGRFLMLRFRNSGNAVLSKISVNLTQYNKSGKCVGKTQFDQTVSYENGRFVLNKKIDVSKSCVSFAVDISAVEYGNYRYTAEGGKVKLDYVKTEPRAVYDASAEAKPLGKKKRAVTTRRITSYFAMGVLAVVLAACAVAFTFAQLWYFMLTAEGFREGGVEYAFVTDSNGVCEGVTVTGYSGFSGKVVIPASVGEYKVLSIYSGAFEGSNIKSLSIEGEIEIESRAFYQCTSLTTINLDKVTYIGEFAFSGCDSLESVTIGGDEDLTVTLSPYAFQNCSSLTSVTIESPTVYPSAGNLFNGSSSLQNLSLYNLNTGDDDVFTISALCGTSAKNSVKNIYIRSLGYIASSTFAGLGISSLEVDNLGSTEIPASAFRACSSLTNLDLPVKITSVGDYAFYNCAIKSFDFSKTDTIGKYAFSGSNITSASLSSNTQIKQILSYTFYKCTKLTTVSLPYNCDTIAAAAFSGCTALTTLTLNSRLSTIGDNAFYGCTALTDVEFYASLTTIGDKAFQGCSSLKSVAVGAGVKELGTYAFAECSSVTSVTFSSGLTTISEGAFSGCTSLASLEFPSYVTAVNSYAFSSCTSLTSVEIPSTLTTVGSGVFGGCTGMRSITFYSMPNTLSHYFGGYVPESLADVTVQNGTIPAYAFNECYYVKNITLPEGLTAIESYTFANCDSLTGIDIPDTVTYIASYAFYDCGALAEIVLPAKLRYIYEYAFYNCALLSYVELPSSLYNIYSYAFYSCYKLREVCNYSSLSLSAGSDDYGMAAAYAIIVYSDSSERAYTVSTSYNGIDLMRANNVWYVVSADSTSSLNISSLRYGTLSITSYKVAPYSFYQNTVLTSVTFGSGLTEIGANAFNGGTKLADVTFPNSLTIVNSYAFANCTALTSVDLPSSLTTIGSYAFAWDSALAEVVLRSSPAIGENAFNGCTKLYEVFDLGGMGVTAGSSSYGMIGYNALCVYNDINAERRVTTYGSIVFLKTGSVWSLVKYSVYTNVALALPETLTSPSGSTITSYTISDYAFNGATVRYLVIPTSVSAVSEYAFYNFSYNYIYYCGSETQWDKISSVIPGNLMYYVSCVHESGNYWTYNSSGSIATGVSTSETVAVAATCTSEGRMNVVCNVCGSVLSYYSIDKVEHDPDSSGVCSMCGAQGDIITDTTYSSAKYLTVTNDTDNPYEYEDGAWHSTNSDRATSSEFTVKAKSAVKLHLSLNCSASYADKITIIITYADGTQSTVGILSGGQSGSYVFSLEKGASVTVKFTRNSTTSGTNRAVISLIVAYPWDDE